MKKAVLFVLALTIFVFSGCATPLKNAGIDESKLPPVGTVKREVSKGVRGDKYAIGILPVIGNSDVVLVVGSAVIGVEKGTSEMPVVYQMAINKKTSDIVFYYFPLNADYIRTKGGQCVSQYTASHYRPLASDAGLERLGVAFKGVGQCSELLPDIQRVGLFPMKYGSLAYYSSSWFKINKPVDLSGEEQIISLAKDFLKNVKANADFTVSIDDKSGFTSKAEEWQYVSAIVSSDAKSFEDAVKAATYLSTAEIQNKIKEHFSPIGLDTALNYRFCIYNEGCVNVVGQGRLYNYALGSCSLISGKTLRDAIKEVNYQVAKRTVNFYNKPEGRCEKTNRYSYFLIDDEAYRLTPPFKSTSGYNNGVIKMERNYEYLNSAKVIYTVTSYEMSSSNCVIVRGNLQLKGISKEEMRSINEQIAEEEICIK